MGKVLKRKKCAAGPGWQPESRAGQKISQTHTKYAIMPARIAMIRIPKKA